MASTNRSLIEVYYDILRATHTLVKTNKRPSMYSIGRLAAMPHGRLKVKIGVLRDHGLLDSGMHVTKKGYEFCEDFLKKFVPMSQKYGLFSPHVVSDVQPDPYLPKTHD